MAKTGISVVLSDSAIGSVPISYGVALMAIPTSTTISGAYSVQTIYSVDDVASLTTTDWDTNNLWNIQEFYAQAGSGAMLHLVEYNETAGLDFTKLKAAIESTVATSWNNRPRLIGITQPHDFTAPESGLSTVLTTASTGQIASLKTLITDLFADSFRVVAILDAGVTGALSTLPDASTYEVYGASLLITSSDGTGDHTASVGMALGRLASVGISTSIGNMTLGNVGTVNYFVDADDNTRTNVALAGRTMIQGTGSVGEKQYLFTRSRVGNGGVYFNDDATMNSGADALSNLYMVRVANAVCDDAEAFFQQVINTQVPVVASGDINPAFSSSMQSAFRSNYITPRIAAGEISDANVTISALNNNFVSSKTLVVSISLLPAPNATWVDVNTVYVSSL